MLKRIISLLAVILVYGTKVDAQSLYDTSENMFSGGTHNASFRELPPGIHRLDKRDGLLVGMIDIGNVHLYVQQEGKGIPLVLLHGGPGATSHVFHPFFKEAGAFARVIYYDQRGCGLSDYKREGGYSIDQSVEDLENLRKKLNIGRWVVLGHSYGGFLAQYYATRFPGSVLGLILVGSSVPMNIEHQFADDNLLKSKNESSKIDSIWNLPGSDYPWKIFNAFLSGDWKRQNFYKPTFEKMAQIATHDSKSDTVYNFQVRRSLRNIDLTDYFLHCPIPTLIMEGRWDLLWHPLKKDEFQRQHPSSGLVVFENSNHHPFTEEPELFMREIKKWITAIKPPNNEELIIWRKHMETLKNSRKENEHTEREFITQFDNNPAAAVSGFPLDQLKKSLRPSTLLRLANEYTRANDVSRATTLLEFARRCFPNSADIYESLGDLYTKSGNRTLAMENYKKACFLNPYATYLIKEMK